MPAPKKKPVAKKPAVKKPVAKKTAAKKSAKRATTAASKPAEPASHLIDARIAMLGDWRGRMLSRVRAVIRAADSGVVEEWKWSVPVWSRDGILCTGETYKEVVKLTFAKGASLPDPARLFNSSLGGGTRRAIDLREGDDLDEQALATLVRAAAARNTESARG